jgi:hypothetical protein
MLVRGLEDGLCHGLVMPQKQCRDLGNKHSDLRRLQRVWAFRPNTALFMLYRQYFTAGH